MTHTFTINKKLTTLNEYINLERTNKFIAAKIKKSETLLCSIIAKQAIKYKINTPFELKIEWYNYREDPDNIAFAKKFILDGLQKAKIIENDNQKTISSLHDYFLSDNKTSHYCIVTISEIGI